jgi:hypothetical protein
LFTEITGILPQARRGEEGEARTLIWQLLLFNVIDSKQWRE